MTTYNEIIHGESSSSSGTSSLKTNLINFRKWATKSANITVHGALTIVNGEATDGTRNAPVLVFESTAVDPRSSSSTDGKDGLSSGNKNNNSTTTSSSEVQCGAIDSTQDRNMYDRSIGCQVRTCRDLKMNEVALSIPREAMITPDLIMGSDAGLAIFDCIQQPSLEGGGGEHEFQDSDNSNKNNYWKSFGNTAKLEKLQMMKIQQNSGTQLLVKILQERKKVETVLNKAHRMAVERRSQQGQGGINKDDTSKLVQSGLLSYRAPFLAFLIHQRFANEHKPLVNINSSNTNNILPEGTPETFAPYARTLPSSISVPICWKRNELALLAGCIPGMPALQKVAARTMQLSSELINLVNAGILYKFPNVFGSSSEEGEGNIITWDRWVWAAAVYESRVLMTSSLPSWFMDGSGAAVVNSSPPNVWENCGVLIPFLDMLNHEDDAAQTQWHRALTTNEGEVNDASTTTTQSSDGRLNIITTEKTKKHSQLYRNYGMLDNEQFMQQFGFTRMSNPADKVRIAWALVDGVGNVDPPTDYEAVSNNEGLLLSQHVFDSLDADSVKSWWTEQRISLLGKVTNNNDETLESLRKGKKITFCAYNNGKIDPYLIGVAIVATLPPEQVMKVSLGGNNNNSKQQPPLDGLILDKTCQNSVRMYLSFLFAKKLGKLLQSLNSCLKDHFNSVQLWTKATKGGLNYVSSNDNDSSTMSSVDGGGGEKSAIMGWQTFFDTYAWYSTMEVEERYYSMTPDSCVLTLYDGHVRSLQNSLDVITTDAVFHDNVKQQLVDLGCTLDNTNTTPIVKNENAAQAVVTQSPATSAVVPDKDMGERVTVKSGSSSSKDNEKKAAAQDPSPPKNDNNNTKVGEGGTTNKRGDRHKSNKSNKGNRPPAIKLHIGNLSYKTLPNQLYDFFTKLYGKDSVLECHIPTERDTGNSRGFGFVTMPENDAKAALESGNTHEMDGRILKVAESNSAGGGRGGRDGNGGGGGGRNVPPQNDRCQQCGYRPRWCTCNPNMMPMNHIGGGMGGPPDTIYGPGPYNNNMALGPPMGPGGGYGYPNEMDGFGWGGGGSSAGGNDNRGGGWSRYSRSRSPSYRRSDRDRGYRRRSRSYSYSRSRSRSYSRDRHHRGGRHHDDDRRRYDDDRRRGSSRRYRSKSRSRSPGRVNEEDGDQKSGERERSLSRSRSPNKNEDQGGKRKRDRSRRRRKRSRKERRSRS